MTTPIRPNNPNKDQTALLARALSNSAFRPDSNELLLLTVSSDQSSRESAIRNLALPNILSLPCALIEIWRYEHVLARFGNPSPYPCPLQCPLRLSRQDGHRLPRPNSGGPFLVEIEPIYHVHLVLQRSQRRPTASRSLRATNIIRHPRNAASMILDNLISTNVVTIKAMS